jgi:hypothetical protein
MRSERTPLKNGEPTVGFSFTTMLQHAESVLVKDFLVKYNAVTLEQHHTPLVWFQIIIFACASTEISIEEMALL